MKNSRQTQVYSELRRKIIKGDFQPGEFLPSLRVLAKDFSASVTPVYRAIQQLEGEGLLEVIHGSGVRITPRHLPLRKPMVQFLGVTANYYGNQPPAKHYTLPATSDWLLWELTHCPDIVAGVAHFPAGDDKSFVARLRDAAYSEAKVIVFASPESPGPEAREWLDTIREEGKHVAYMGNRVDLPGCDRVRGDYREGSRNLTHFLLAAGHRCILRLHGDLTLWYEQQKQQGFEMAIHEWNQSGAKPAHGILRLAASERAEGRLLHDEEAARNVELIEDALQQAPFTAIMAPNDAATVILRLALARLGKLSISVTGYDGNWHELDYFNNFKQAHAHEVEPCPPIASVDSGFRQTGIELARLAIARAKGQLPPDPQTILVPHALVRS